MSKTRNKNGSELEYLRGELKKQKSLVRQLKKKLKQYERKNHFFESALDNVAEEIEVKEDACPSCNKGTLQVTDLVHLIITYCDQCDYQKRQRPRKNGKKT